MGGWKWGGFNERGFKFNLPVEFVIDSEELRNFVCCCESSDEFFRYADWISDHYSILPQRLITL